MGFLMEYNSTHANAETRASLLHIHTYMIYMSTHTDTHTYKLTSSELSPVTLRQKAHILFVLEWAWLRPRLSIFVLLKEGFVMVESGHTENQWGTTIQLGDASFSCSLFLVAQTARVLLGGSFHCQKWWHCLDRHLPAVQEKRER